MHHLIPNAALCICLHGSLRSMIPTKSKQGVERNVAFAWLFELHNCTKKPRCQAKIQPLLIHHPSSQLCNLWLGTRLLATSRLNLAPLLVALNTRYETAQRLRSRLASHVYWSCNGFHPPLFLKGGRRTGVSPLNIYIYISIYVIIVFVTACS